MSISIGELYIIRVEDYNKNDTLEWYEGVLRVRDIISAKEANDDIDDKNEKFNLSKRVIKAEIISGNIKPSSKTYDNIVYFSTDSEYASKCNLIISNSIKMSTELIKKNWYLTKVANIKAIRFQFEDDGDYYYDYCFTKDNKCVKKSDSMSLMAIDTSCSYTENEITDVILNKATFMGDSISVSSGDSTDNTTPLVLIQPKKTSSKKFCNVIAEEALYYIK